MYMHLPASPHYGELLSKTEHTAAERTECEKLAVELGRMRARDEAYFESFLRDSGLMVADKATFSADLIVIYPDTSRRPITANCHYIAIKRGPRRSA